MTKILFTALATLILFSGCGDDGKTDPQIAERKEHVFRRGNYPTGLLNPGRNEPGAERARTDSNRAR